MFGNLPLTSLRAFEALARTSSPSSAANELSVTPGAITRQVRELETLLNLRLFDRTRGQWKLTHEGDLLASTIAVNLQEIRFALDSLPFNSQRPLRIGISRALATLIVAPRLNEFLNIVPDTVIYIDGDRQGDLPRPGLDLVIRYGIPQSLPDKDLTFLPAGRLFPAASPTILPSSIPTEPDEWPNVKLLSFMVVDHWSQWFAATKYIADRAPIVHFSDSTMLFEAAVAGVGITMAHSVVCHRLLQERRLIPIGSAVQISHQYFALSDPGKSHSAGLFLDWLYQIMADAESCSAPFLQAVSTT